LNFILDIGDVLVEYQPVAFLRRLFSDEQLVEKLNNIIFKSAEWLHMDQGIYTHDEAIEMFYERDPELKPEILYTMQNVPDMFVPKAETIKLLPTIKSAGHGLYYLSNIHREIRDFLLAKHEYLKLFDGGVFSCDVNAIKPSPEIYRHLLEKYSLVPSGCIFFDDMEKNVSAAEKEGIKGVLFTTAECISYYL